jgi:hypothetical protein
VQKQSCLRARATARREIQKNKEEERKKDKMPSSPSQHVAVPSEQDNQDIHVYIQIRITLPCLITTWETQTQSKIKKEISAEHNRAEQVKHKNKQTPGTGH